eukprot:1146917-Pelagomonas_calceolata.AAC.1
MSDDDIPKKKGPLGAPGPSNKSFRLNGSSRSPQGTAKPPDLAHDEDRLIERDSPSQNVALVKPLINKKAAPAISRQVQQVCSSRGAGQAGRSAWTGQQHHNLLCDYVHAQHILDKTAIACMHAIAGPVKGYNGLHKATHPPATSHKLLSVINAPGVMEWDKWRMLQQKRISKGPPTCREGGRGAASAPAAVWPMFSALGDDNVFLCVHVSAGANVVSPSMHTSFALQEMRCNKSAARPSAPPHPIHNPHEFPLCSSSSNGSLSKPQVFLVQCPRQNLPFEISDMPSGPSNAVPRETGIHRRVPAHVGRRGHLVVCLRHSGQAGRGVPAQEHKQGSKCPTMTLIMLISWTAFGAVDRLERTPAYKHVKARAQVPWLKALCFFCLSSEHYH